MAGPFLTEQDMLAARLAREEIFRSDTPVVDEEEEDDDEEDSDEEDAGSSKMSNSEIKSRKAMAKLGMKLLPNVNRVTIKNSPNSMFVIVKPDVFKHPSLDSYVIFGEARIEDIRSQLMKEAAQPSITQPDEPPTRVQAEKEGGDGTSYVVDENDLDLEDITTVMSQAGVSRSKAVEALKYAGGDVVTAIMDYASYAN